MEIITPFQALAKAYKYCAYQERCQQEVREKLYSFQLQEDEVENIIVKLIEENFLNEERFAIAFAGGKFRVNNWGKSKIKQTLKQKQVSEYCIKKGLSVIDTDNYIGVLKKLASSKNKTLHDANKFARAKKLQNYLLSKGFENDLIMTEIKLLLKL